MSWDLALDGTTSDLIWAGNLDLLGAQGDGVTRQRIMTRLKIVRGQWVYDADRTLGSRLDVIKRYSLTRSLREAEVIVAEALEDMRDVTIVEITVEASETIKDQLEVRIFYRPAVSPGEAADESLLQETLQAITVPLPNIGLSPHGTVSP